MHARMYTHTRTRTCAHRHTHAPAVHQEWLGICVAVVFPNLCEELEQWTSIQRNAKIWPSREVELPHCLCLAGLLHLAGKEERRNTVHSTTKQRGFPCLPISPSTFADYTYMDTRVQAGAGGWPAICVRTYAYTGVCATSRTLTGWYSMVLTVY